MMDIDSGSTTGTIFVCCAPAQNAGKNTVSKMNESHKNIDDGIPEDEDGFNELAYVRVKAGDVLIRCLEDCSGTPMRQLVEALILAGPENLVVLREIKTETNQRKVQVGDDINQVLSGLRTNLQSFNVRFRGLKKASTLVQMKPSRFMTMIKNYGIVDLNTQNDCMQLYKDAQDLAGSLLGHYSLLAHIEEFLEDWIMGVSYQLAHQEHDKSIL
jgi:hypothetical protein